MILQRPKHWEIGWHSWSLCRAPAGKLCPSVLGPGLAEGLGWGRSHGDGRRKWGMFKEESAKRERVGWVRVSAILSKDWTFQSSATISMRWATKTLHFSACCGNTRQEVVSTPSHCLSFRSETFACLLVTRVQPIRLFPSVWTAPLERSQSKLSGWVHYLIPPVHPKRWKDLWLCEDQIKSTQLSPFSDWVCCEAVTAQCGSARQTMREGKHDRVVDGGGCEGGRWASSALDWFVYLFRAQICLCDWISRNGYRFSLDNSFKSRQSSF